MMRVLIRLYHGANGSYPGWPGAEYRARRLHFDFEVRTLPQDDAQEVARELESYAQRELLPAMHAVNRDAEDPLLSHQ
jgi:hypothetical protein